MKFCLFFLFQLVLISPIVFAQAIGDGYDSVAPAQDLFVSEYRRKQPIQLQFILNTLGIGGAVGVHADAKHYFGFERTATSRTIVVRESLVKGEFLLFMETNHFVYRYSFYRKGGLYFQTGVFLTNWSGNGTLRLRITGEKIATAQMSFPPTGANVGIGWHWFYPSGLSGGFGLGVGSFFGESKAKVFESTAAEDLTENYKTLKTTAADTVDASLAVVPMVSFSLGYNF